MTGSPDEAFVYHQKLRRSTQNLSLIWVDGGCQQARPKRNPAVDGVTSRSASVKPTLDRVRVVQAHESGNRARKQQQVPRRGRVRARLSQEPQTTWGKEGKSSVHSGPSRTFSGTFRSPSQSPSSDVQESVHSTRGRASRNSSGLLIAGGRGQAPAFLDLSAKNVPLEQTNRDENKRAEARV